MMMRIRIAGFPLLMAAASAAMLLGAAYFEHIEGLLPCALCLWQRWPHRLVVALGLVAILTTDSRPHRIIMGLQTLSLIAGAGIAFWHGGVELGLLPGLPSCSAARAADILGGDTAAALDRLLAATPVPCDKVAWSFLGISMAVWNGLISLAFAAIIMLKLRHDR